jgi:hypothetical protein
MSNQYAQLVERINRIVRDRGDVELMVLLDRIADKPTEAEQAASLGAVVKILNQNKKPNGESGTQAPAQHASAAPVTQAPTHQVEPSQVNGTERTNPNPATNTDGEDSSS